MHFSCDGKLGLHLSCDGERDSQVYLEKVHIGSLAASEPILQARFDCSGTGELRDNSAPVVLRTIHSKGSHKQEIQGLEFDRVLDLLRSATRPLSVQFAVLHSDSDTGPRNKRETEEGHRRRIATDSVV